MNGNGQEERICSICLRPLSPGNCNNEWTMKYGNNAAPVNSGRCCTYCDEKFVIPIRILRVRAGRADDMRTVYEDDDVG